MKTTVLLLLALSLFSCQKNKFPSTVTTGDFSSAQEVGYNFLLNGSFSNPKSELLDLDNDGVFDVQLNSTSAAVTGSGIMPEISITTLHENVEMNVNIRQDSIFQAYFYHWQYAPDGSKAYFHVNVTSCSKESAQYTPIGVETNAYLVPLSEDEILSTNDTYQSGTFHIATAESHETSIEQFPDSTVYRINETRKSCFEFPQEVVRYLGFRMTDETGQKLGWIELQYLGGNHLRIQNWAIQRK
ncbi:MAG: hypothetical protein NXI10_16230 [bacterium]|nr:hypothetical protein [bacterium]